MTRNSTWPHTSQELKNKINFFLPAVRQLNLAQAGLDTDLIAFDFDSLKLKKKSEKL